MSYQGLESLLTGLSNLFPSNPATSESQKKRSVRVEKRNNNDNALGNNPELYSKLRESVTYLTTNVLGSMVCGQDNTEISTSNFQIVAGKGLIF